ncbi:MAG TPA: MASE1 domain-containing protein [Polyangiales bacterium]
MTRRVLMLDRASSANVHATSSFAAHLAIQLLVALAYFAAAKLGFLLASSTKQVTAVWPPTGIAMVALLVLGRHMWPAVFAGAFAVNLTNDTPLLTSFGIALGNTLAPLVGVRLLGRWSDFDLKLERVHDVLSFVSIGAVLGMSVSATNGALWLGLTGIVPWTKCFSVWWLWWIGDAMGVLIVAPPILTWIAKPRLRWRGVRLFEWSCLFVSLAATAHFLFSDTFPLTYAVFPFAVWAALRFEQRETALAMLIIASAAIWGVIHDRGPFAVGPSDARLIFLVLFMGVMAITALVLGAATHERKRAEHALLAAGAKLETRVAERTAELASANDSLKKVNQQHTRRGQALAAKQDEAESFVYVVSHDLRAPLVNIQGFSEELRAGCRDLEESLRDLPLPAARRQAIERILAEGIRESLGYIAASTTKLQHLIDALLVLSRTGREQYTLMPIDSDALAEASVGVLRQTIEKGGARVELSPLPAAYGDSTAIGQVFTNLIGNAVKYLQPGRAGVIEVGGETQDEMSHFWVRDNGCGFGINARTRLFQAFQRFHPQLASGEGMGLAIVKRVVERHGGRVWAESVEGAGSTFHFTLPASQPQRQSTWRKLA